MANRSSSLFDNKWRHHDITVIAKGYQRDLANFIIYKTPYYISIFRFTGLLFGEN